jgi:CheY-like chemotaxis protein
MAARGPIVIIDNDTEDQELLKLALKGLNVTNKIVFYSDGAKALEYLINSGENPFLIISNVRMPRTDGMTVRRAINSNETLKKKAIPFIFLSELADPDEVNEAYELNVQGYFTKPNSIEALEEKLSIIIKYWQACVEPNQLLY